MIIILQPVKDTYVTNIKTQKNDGLKSNVGNASTLDLFKLYNENKNGQSWAAFKFTSTIADSNTLVLTDSNGTTKTFEFDTIADPGSITEGNIRISINGENASSYATILKNTINSVSNFDISAHSNSNNELVLKQNKPGSSGDTSFVLPVGGGMEHIGGSSNTSFARIDYSSLLLKFDLNSFKENWINLINDTNNDGIDEDGGTKDDLPGSFRNLKAELILKDVTTGITKPKDYKLKVFSLLKDFNEGTGKDTIHFSDSGSSNFNNLTDTLAWEIPGYISGLDANDLSSSFDVIKGNEDLKFDITNYIKSELVKNVLDDKGFLIKFDESNVYDAKSYFAKRLGSRHLLNKTLIPQLRIKIDDSSYNIPVNSFNKKRYLDNIEEFYLFNNTNGSLSNFSTPVGSYSLKLKIKSKDNISVYSVKTANSTSTSPIVNFKGEKLSGIRKAQLGNTDLSKFNSIIEKDIKKGKLEANYEWVWNDDSDETKTVAAGSFTIGRKYKIKTLGTTNFSLIGGDSDPVVGETFFAGGIGSGTGDAYEIEKTIISDRVDFYLSEVPDETRYENIVTSIKTSGNSLEGNDSNKSIEVYFIDTKKEFNAVKTPYELPSENLGDVFYQVYNTENNEVLLDYDEGTQDININATKMFFDGEKYIFNFFIPKILKNTRINFKFKFKDPINNTDKIVYNEKYKVRII